MAHSVEDPFQQSARRAHFGPNHRAFLTTLGSSREPPERLRAQPHCVGGCRVVTLTRLNRLVRAIQSTNAPSVFSS